MSRSGLLPSLLLIATLLSACSSDGDPLIASMLLGDAGGTLEITAGDLEGFKLEVPPAALDASRQISAEVDVADANFGFRNIGRAVRLFPDGSEFLLPVTLTMPFDFTPSSAANEVVVLKRAPNNTVVELARSVLPTRGRSPVVVDIGSLGTFWAGERIFRGLATRLFFRFADGDVWNFENGITLNLDATSMEPNLGGMSVFRLMFTRPDQSFGLYLIRDSRGGGRLMGTFINRTSGDSLQQVHDETFFLGNQVTINQPQQAFYRYEGYAPFGSTESTYSGTAIVDMVPELVEELTTPLGIFKNLLKMTATTTFTRTTGEHEVLRYVLVLEESVGPVAVEAFGFGSSGLIDGMVNGSPIEPEEELETALVGK